MISLDHNHHSSSPQNSKQNDLLQDHKTFDWDDLGPAADGTDFLASALGVDSTVDINADILGDDFSSYVNDTHFTTTSHPPTPVKSTDGTDAATPLRDRSSSLSPPPDTVSPAPVTGSTLTGEENEEGESGEPQREEEEEDEEENANGASVAQDGKQEDGRRKEDEQQQFLNATDSLGSPLSELSPPPDQDDDEPAKPEREEQAQTSTSTRPQNTSQPSQPETTKSPSTTATKPGGKIGDATSSRASNAMNPGAGPSVGSIGGPPATNQLQNAHIDHLSSAQNATPGSAGPSSTDPRVTTILELNNELFRIGTEFQGRGLIPADDRWQQYATRLQSNLTWLAASADQRNGAATLPNMTPPPPVEFYPMERIQQLYSELPTLFAKDIARRQGNQGMPGPTSQPTPMGTPMPTYNAPPSLKRDRPSDDVPNIGDTNALKRRNTGSGPEIIMMPPPSTSPTNPRPLSAASNHSQPPSAMSISSPLSAGPPSAAHMSPPSSTNGLPGSISTPGLSARSTPTPGPGHHHTSPVPTSSSTSPRQPTPSVSALSGPDLMEAQAAAHMRERARQVQIREAQIRATQQAAQQSQAQRAQVPQQQHQQHQQQLKMAAGMANAGATPGNPMAMGGNEAASGAMNGMGGANAMSHQAPSEIQRQLVAVLQTPGHPMVAYMHRIMPNFGSLPVQQQMQKMWMAQNMIKQQQQNQANQQHQQGFPNPSANMNTMPQMSPPPNAQQQQKSAGMGQNPFPTIGVTPSSPAPPQSPVVPQLTGGGGMNNANMFGLDNPSNPMGAGGNAPQAGGGIDPRLLPPGMNMNNMTPIQRQQLLMMQQQASRGNPAAPNASGMPMNMGGAGGMAGANAGMAGNAQNMMSMMTPQQQQQQQQFNMAQAQQDRQRQQQMAMGVGMPSNPALMAGPSIARSARSPSDTMQNPMTPRLPPQHAGAAGAGMQRQGMGTEDYARLMQQQAAQAQRALSARSPAGFNPQQAAGAGGWQGHQQQPGMNMGMNMGGGMAMGMNPQQQQNPSAGYGMSPPGSAGGMYPGASSPTGTSHGGQGPMWSSTANADHGAQMRHMSGTPGPQPTQNMGASGMMDPSLSSSEFDLFHNWAQ